MHKTWCLIFTFLFCSVACVSFAHASDTSHRAAVEKLLLALNVQKNVSSFYEQMKDTTERMFKQINVPENELAMAVKMRNSSNSRCRSNSLKKGVFPEIVS